MSRKRDRFMRLFTSSGKKETKEKGRYAPYLSAAAWVAGTVSELSDAVPPLKLTADVLKVVFENASTMEENKSSAEDLCARIKRLLEITPKRAIGHRNLNYIELQN